MTQINRTALVAYSAEKLYQLVLDVSAYPQFLPWCSDAKIIEQSEIQQIASVSIRKGPVNTSFTTQNSLIAPEIRVDREACVAGEIKMELIDGPFRQLDGYWRFHVLSTDACKVEMNMDFAFTPGPLGLLLKPVFSQICSTLLNAFVQRAHELYEN